MTTPPMDPNLTNATPVTAKPVKAGPPRAVLLGSVVAGLAVLAAGGFYFMSQNSGDEGGDVAEAPVPPTQRAPVSPAGRPAQTTPKPAVDPAVAAGKAQAAQALGAFPGRVNLGTSFDSVPPTLGGTGKPLYPVRSVPIADNGGKAKPIVQGKLPSGLRSDPFVSRLVIPLTREFAYTLAVPIRLASPPRPAPVIKRDLSPDVEFGPLPYVARRVAGFLEFGGVSAIVETGQFGSGDITIVQPGATVPSGVAGIPPLTVESISSTEMVLRAVDGRTARVALSGIPGGAPVTNPGGGGVPGGGGPPGGPPGAPGRGGRGGGPTGVE